MSSIMHLFRRSLASIPSTRAQPLDSAVLSAVASRAHLPHILSQYDANASTVLKHALPYESTPSAARRAGLDSNKLVLVAHCARSQDGTSKIMLSSGFALDVQGEADDVVLTCAHTLEEIRRSPVLPNSVSSGSVVISRVDHSSSFTVSPIARVLSALPRSDLLLLSVPGKRLPTLPVSPYPAPIGTPIRAHFISDIPVPPAPLASPLPLPSAPAIDPSQAPKRQLTTTSRIDTSEIKFKSKNGTTTTTTTNINNNDSDSESCRGSWEPWLGQWGTWMRGRVLGYRDWAGSDAHPGTYDALAHLLFAPLPTPGSSGGPIIDEQTGAVVGVIRGTRMDSAVEGLRGWAVPAETIYEMFALPGLERRD